MSFDADPKTLGEALDRVPDLSDLAGIPRSEMRRLVCTTWPAWARVKAIADPANFATGEDFRAFLRDEQTGEETPVQWTQTITADDLRSDAMLAVSQ